MKDKAGSELRVERHHEEWSEDLRTLRASDTSGSMKVMREGR